MGKGKGVAVITGLPINNQYFKLHLITGHISTIYLVEYSQGLLLLDCGSASDVGRIEAKCHEIGRLPTDIRLAVATHAHPDHMGGAAKLRAKYRIPIAAHPDIDRWYQGLGGFVQHQIDSFFANWVAVKSGRYPEKVHYKRRIKPDYQIQDGSKLPIFIDWEVIGNPGHTRHDIALFHPKSQTLYWADSICSANGKLHLPVPVLYPELMAQSLHRMVALNPSCILLAHGGAVNIKDQEKLASQVEIVLNQENNPHIDRLQNFFLFSRTARQGLKKGI